MASLTLPEGRQGQVAAVAATVVMLLFFLLAVILPACQWYQARQDRLVTEQQIASHMVALQRLLPRLKQQISEAAAPTSSAQILLPGASDAIGAANLQADVQDLATKAGTSLTSTTMVPAQPAGTLRRIGVAVSVTGTWPALTALLRSIDSGRPRMIVDDLSITASAGGTTPAASDQDAPLQANFSIAAFRAGGPS